VQFELNIISVHGYSASTCIYDIARLNLAPAIGAAGPIFARDGWLSIGGGGVNFLAAAVAIYVVCSLVGKLLLYRVGRFGIPKLETRNIITSEGVCGLHYPCLEDSFVVSATEVVVACGSEMAGYFDGT